MKSSVIIVCAVLGYLAGSCSAQAIDPNVTQDNIAITICSPGYTALVRPSVSYTNRVKRRLLNQNGISWAHASEYELDHIVPLEVGGAPSNPKNLQLQKWDAARPKDAIETATHRLVCSGRLTLAQGQARFMQP